MDPGHSSEYISAHWGSLRAGHSVNFLPSSSLPSVDALRQKILEEQPSVIVLSPNHSTHLADANSLSKKKDLLAQALPEVFAQSSMENIGQALALESLPNLKFIVQTGFYNLPGFLKFRDMLVYRSNKYNTSKKIPNAPVFHGKEEHSGIDQFKVKLEANISSEQMQNAIVYNVLDLQDPNSVNSLLACLTLAQEKGLLTNVIPQANLEGLLLETGFVNDLTENYNSIIVGNTPSLEKIRQKLDNNALRFLDVSGK